ncbi:MAG: glycoside hydrolase family 3 protein [Clostridiales bacterium]|jgi:beta-N-acetylhexosaminidase|nr:glycoside hydrolase family 3 protein [Clostridiales bacterium]
MKQSRLAAVFCALLLTAACAAPDIQASRPSAQHRAQTPARQSLDVYIGDMSLEAQVEQLFIVRLGAKNERLDAPGDAMFAFIDENPAGGYALFANNISTISNANALTAAISRHAVVPPFIAIDEEGGLVSRIDAAGMPGFTPQPGAAAHGATRDTSAAYESARYMGRILRDMGINLNFAPVADVWIETGYNVLGSRSYGSDPALVADMAAAYQSGLMSEGILSCPKHFPGLGGAVGDPHDGQSVGDDSALGAGYLPFVRAIEGGAPFIMVGHIVVPGVDESDVPASLSRYFITQVLREELAFEGLIITDAMNMRAITDSYTPAEAAVLAISAGADIILMPADYAAAKEGVLFAVANDRITPQRIRDSVKRVLQTKLDAGLFTLP